MKGVKVYRNGARTGGVQRFKPSTPYTHRASPQVNPWSEAVLGVLVALAALAVIAAGVAFLALNGWMVPT